MAELTANYETGVHGSNLTVTDTGDATAFDGFWWNPSQCKYDNTRTAVGSLACKHQESNSIAMWVWEAAVTAQGNPADHYGRMYLNIDALPSTTIVILRCPAGAGVTCEIRLDTTGHLILYNAAALQTFTTAIPVDQWVRIEWHFIHADTPSSLLEAKLWLTATSSGAADETKSDTSANCGFGLQSVGVGIIHPGATGGSEGPIWTDGVVALATSYPGPATTVGPQVATPFTFGAVSSAKVAAKAQIASPFSFGAFTTWAGAAVDNALHVDNAAAAMQVLRSEDVGSGLQAQIALADEAPEIIPDLTGATVELVAVSSGAAVALDTPTAGARLCFVRAWEDSGQQNKRLFYRRDGVAPSNVGTNCEGYLLQAEGKMVRLGAPADNFLVIAESGSAWHIACEYTDT